jgi:site-specific recombinase XerD
MGGKIMSKVVIAKNTNLRFLTTSRKIGGSRELPLPMILKKGGSFDWAANAYLTEIGGGARSYNVKLSASTVIKKAYSLNLFCSFLEELDIELNNINDSTLYSFISHLKERDINDDTLLSHGKAALNYIIFLTNRNADWNLSTNQKDPEKQFKVHYSIKTYKKGTFETKYNHHDSFSGLIHISYDMEYVRDHELLMWYEAIETSNYHPQLSEFLTSRWQALTTALNITGSRISEVHQIKRSMIKDAAKSLFTPNQKIVIRNIPVSKGKYSGKFRQVQTTSEDLQILLWHVQLIEATFKSLDHDAIFVDSRTGKALTAAYLKNYTKKVINTSKYRHQLSHLTNHSFRHRFITLLIAREIKKLTASGSFSNILSVASTACRKVTLHASNQTLSHYIHLATEYNREDSGDTLGLENEATPLRIRVQKMLTTVKLLRQEQIGDKQALEELVHSLDSLSPFFEKN